MAGCGQASVIVNEDVTVSVTEPSDPVTAVQTVQPNTTVETRIGELSWKEETITVIGPVTSVTHTKLANTIKSIIYVDGTPIRWAKVGIEKNGTTLDFSGSPYTVTEEVIFEYK